MGFKGGRGMPKTKKILDLKGVGGQKNWSLWAGSGMWRERGEFEENVSTLRNILE